jgi:antitoxin component YwqK of YwqJK toxin-antitoxin module
MSGSARILRRSGISIAAVLVCVFVVFVTVDHRKPQAGPRPESVTINLPEPPRDPPPPVLMGTEVKLDDLVLRDGRRYRPEETTPFTGLMTQFYADGTLQSRSVISNGLLEGLSEGWYTNGCKQVEELYHNGVSHGLRVKWYENGNMLSEAPVVAGKLVGVFKRWHENGVLAEKVPMRDGNANGLVRAYYPSGFLKAEARLADGVVSEQKNWGDGESPVRSSDTD